MSICYKCNSYAVEYIEPDDNIQYSICNNCDREFISKEQTLENEKNVLWYKHTQQ